MRTYGIGGGAARQRAEAFTPLLVMRRDARQTVPAASGDVFLAIAPEGHREGVEKTIIVPAGNADTFTIPPDLNVEGDAFDDTKDFLLFITYAGGRFKAVGHALDAADVVAPTVESATVSVGNKDGLVVVFSEPVYLPDLVGLSLDFSVGTPRTITAIEAGNGTDTVTLTLSSVLDGSEVFDLVLEDATAQDLDGNLVADDTVAVSNNADGPVFADTIAWWRADNTVQAAGKITQWTDKSGNGNHAVQADTNKQALYSAAGGPNSTPMGDFDGTDDGYRVAAPKVATLDPSDYAAYTLVVVVKMDTTGADQELLGTGAPLNEETAPRFLVINPNQLWFTEVLNANKAATTFSDTASFHVFLGTSTGTDRSLYVDDLVTPANVNTTDENPGAIRELSLGFGVQVGNVPLNGKVCEALIIGHALDADERAELDAYFAVRYGL